MDDITSSENKFFSSLVGAVVAVFIGYIFILGENIYSSA
jgi:hypothetical protein